MTRRIDSRDREPVIHQLSKLKPDPVTSFAEARARLRADPWQAILNLIAIAVMAGFAIYRFESHTPATVAVLLAALAAFYARVSFPLLALLALVFLMLPAMHVAGSFVGPILTLTILGLVSLSIERSLTFAIPGILLVQLAFFTYLGSVDDDVADGSIIGVVGGTAGAAGLGIAVRSQRQYIQAYRDRAIHAEETREAESRRRVSEERVRIARDLHDAVAHHMAVVNLYTGLARTTMGTSIEQSEAALARAQEATRAVMAEMQQIVHILRDTDAAGTGPRQPAPDATSIEELFSSFGDGGLELDIRTHGQPWAMSASTGLVLYRVVQEALTNAHRYGDGHAEVEIAYGERSVSLTVANRVPHPGSAVEVDGIGTGHGLVGMRERIRMINGTLASGPELDRFVVRAVLPNIVHPAGDDVAPRERTNDQRSGR